ncbi:MAG: hypothetical protein AAF202_09745 [Pseudomonadota bacterium]
MGSLSRTSRQPFLPLYDRVLFVDWHGVLSNGLFWDSIRKNPKKRFKGLADEVHDQIFKESADLVADWMRGAHSTEAVIDAAKPSLSDYQRKILISALKRDCRCMHISEEWRRLLTSKNRKCWIVIATDNADCFWSQIDRIPEISRIFDGALCSSNLKVLKRESPEEFFGGWLRSHGLEFTNSCLVDDSIQNCEAFSGSGGSAIHFTSLSTVSEEISAWLEQ